MSSFKVKVTREGPFFDGRFELQMDEFKYQVVKELTDRGIVLIQRDLAFVLEHPTGYYQSQIHQIQIERYTREINDSAVVYGPWLEGISKRNRSSRFKGYRTFRLMTQKINDLREEVSIKWIIRIFGRL